MNCKLFEKIGALHTEMKQLTLDAKVKEEDYDSAVIFSGVEEIEDIQQVFDFLSKVHEAEFREVKEIWKLLPPEIWKTYLDHGETGLREQKLLRQARRQLRSAWKRFLKDRTYEAKDAKLEDTSSSSK